MTALLRAGAGAVALFIDAGHAARRFRKKELQYQ